MTASEWDKCADPVAMLTAVMPNAGFRKRQLFCLAVWAGVADLLTDKWCREALLLLNAYADEDWRDQGHKKFEAIDQAIADLGSTLENHFLNQLLAGEPELEEALESRTETQFTTWIDADGVRAAVAVAAIAVAEVWRWAFGGGIVRGSPRDFALRATLNAIRLGPLSAKVWAESFQAHTDLLRELFGNPFCPVSFPSSWRTDAVRSLARQMYGSQDFGAMPILADALQDAGCDDDEMLNHCRDTGQTHVRGCWVVDAVFGEYYIAKRW